MKISVVIPCFNEEEAISPVLESIIPIMEGMICDDYELIFVDDGSRDETVHVIELAIASDRHLKPIRLSRILKLSILHLSWGRLPTALISAMIR